MMKAEWNNAIVKAKLDVLFHTLFFVHNEVQRLKNHITEQDTRPESEQLAQRLEGISDTILDAAAAMQHVCSDVDIRDDIPGREYGNNDTGPDRPYQESREYPRG